MLFVNGNGTRGNYKCARLMHTGTYAYTRARVAGDCESQFATAGIRKAASWIQPRGCVELIGYGGELGHRRFTTAIPLPAAWHFVSCVSCARKVSDISDFNCARKIGLRRVRATRQTEFELKMTRKKRARRKRSSGNEKNRIYSPPLLFFSFNSFVIQFPLYYYTRFRITRLEALLAKPF